MTLVTLVTTLRTPPGYVPRDWEPTAKDIDPLTDGYVIQTCDRCGVRSCIYE